MSIFADDKPKRKPFKTSVKKTEWMLARGKNPFTDKFVTKSNCRINTCKTILTCGDRSYEFDYKDNNSANNTQNNCFLVYRNCHSKHTIIKKRAIKDYLGETIGHKTIKKKDSVKVKEHYKRVNKRLDKLNYKVAGLKTN